MSEIKHEEVKREENKRSYRFKYITDDGEVKVIEREMPDEIDVYTGKYDLLKNLVLWLIIASILMFFFKPYGDKNERISATTLKNSIISSVQNGAGLDVVKRIYENRQILDKGILSVFDQEQPEYSFDMPLSSILEDIRADLYLGEKKPDGELVSTINNLIAEYSQKNPFDKLTKQQKEYFENVRQKTGDSYSIIQEDMNNITDELHSQNLLVNTYLSDSRTSLYVSIFALLFALIVSGYQIYQGRPRKVAENLMVLLEGIFSHPKNEEDDSLIKSSNCAT